MKTIALVILLIFIFAGLSHAEYPQSIKTIIEVTKPLDCDRGDRLPLYLWGAADQPGIDEADLEPIIKALDARGIAFIANWNPDDPKNLERSLKIAEIQKKLGLDVSVNASTCLLSFFNGDLRTAHISETGESFFDSSFLPSVKMGCPFALDFRYADIKERVDSFAREYKKRDLPINFVFTDWEIDGPIEWNGAWEASKKCTVCKKNIKNIDNFTEFQAALRKIRSDMQKKTYANVMKSHFPDVLVSNYAVYSDDGFRYWYDFFEDQPSEGMPYKKDQRAKYRQWYDEFPLTGYTFAMPVVYTWYPTFGWYDYTNPDYRWFYNMLLTATNVCKSTPKNTPIISFVHWHTTSPPSDPDPAVKQFSEEKYKELLWHMLLRGTDGLFLWCPSSETAEEARMLHEVYAESLEYREFLEKGEPVTFEVPDKQGPVISGIKLGNRLLIRRTDFDENDDPVEIEVCGKKISIGRIDGKCRKIMLWGCH